MHLPKHVFVAQEEVGNGHCEFFFSTILADMECTATATKLGLSPPLFGREKRFLFLHLIYVIHNIYDSMVFALVMVYVSVTSPCKTIWYPN